VQPHLLYPLVDMLSGLFISLAVFAASAVAAPTQLLNINKYDGEKTGRFIVQFKEGASFASHLSNFRSASSPVNITHQWESDFFNGFAGRKHFYTFIDAFKLTFPHR
jgi:cerevisin